MQLLISRCSSVPLHLKRFHIALWTGLQLPESLFLKTINNSSIKCSCKKLWILIALPGSMCNSLNYERTSLTSSCGNTHGSTPWAANCPAKNRGYVACHSDRSCVRRGLIVVMSSVCRGCFWVLYVTMLIHFGRSAV